MTATAGYLQLVIDSTSVAQGEKALDSIARTGSRVEGSLKIDMGSVEKAMDRLGQKITSLDKNMTASMGRVSSASSQQAKTFEQLRASIDPAYAATVRYQQVQRELAAMVSSGEASQRAANIVLEQAASRYMGVATAAERKADAERMAAQATATASQNYAALRASVDPVYAASKRYEAALETLNAAQQRGVISDKQRKVTLDLLEAQMIASNNSVIAANKGYNAMGYAVTNAGYQVQDFFVQIAAGTDAVRALSMQLPQLLGSFGFAGKFAIWGAGLGTLVAAGSVLIPMLSGMGNGAEKLDETVDDLNSTFDTFIKYTDLANSSLDVLKGQFGDSADEARQAYEALAMLARMDFAAQMAEVGSATEDALSKIVKSVDRIDDVLSKDGPVHGDRAIAKQVERLAENFGLAEEEARSVVSAMNDLENAEGVVDQGKAAQALAQALGAVSADSEKTQNEINGIIKALLEAYLSSRKFNEATENGTKAEKDRAAAAQETIDKYAAQQELAEAVVAHGKDSAQVETLKRNQAEAAAKAFAAQGGYAGETADNIVNAAMAAYDAQVNVANAEVALRKAEAAAQGLARAMASAAGFSASLEGQISVINAQIEAAANKQNVAIAGQVANLRLQAEAHRDAQLAAANGSISAVEAADAEYAVQLKLIDTLADKRDQLDKTTASSKKAASAAAKAAKKIKRELKAIRDSLDPFSKYNEQMERLVALKGYLSDDEMAKAIRNLNVELADSLPLVGDLTDTLVEGLFNGFKGTLSDIGNMFKRWLIEMISMAAKNQIIIGLGGALSGSATSAAASQAGGGILGNLLGGVGTNLLGGGAISGIASGIGGILSGGGLASSFANLGGLMTGAVSGWGAIGAAIPAIGAVALGLTALIGTVKTLDAGIQVTVSEFDALVETYRLRRKSYLFGLVSNRSTVTNAADAAVADPIELAVAEIQGSVLNMSDVLGVAADAFEGFSTVVKISTKDMSEEEALREIQTQLTKVADEMAEITLAGYDVSIAGETASQTLTRLSTSLLAANNDLDALGLSLFDMSVSGAAAASAFADVFGGIEAMQSSLTAYFEAYYSDAEKLAYATRQFETAMNDLGVAIPVTKDQFRALVDAADAIGNKELVGNLIKLAPLFDQIAQATGNAASAAERLVAAQQGVDTAYQAMLTAATNEQKRLEEEYAAAIAPLTAEMDAAQAAADAAKASLDGAMSALDTYVTDEIARLNDEFEASKERLEGIAESAAEMAAMFEEALDRTYDAVVDSLNRQRDEIESSYTAQIDIVSTALAEAQDHAAKFAGAIAALNRALDTRPALNEVAELIGYRAAQAQLASFVSGADFTEDQLNRVLGTLSTDTTKFFGNRADYEFDAAKTRGDMAALLGTLEGEANEPQIVLLEQQLDAMIEARDAQLAALDSQLAEAERIYEEAKGIAGGVDITNATLSDLRLAAAEYISESAKANKIAAESAAELAALEAQSEAQTAHLEEILAEAQAQYDAAVGAEQGIQSVDEGIAALSAAIDHYAETQVTLADVQAVNGPLIEALEAELAGKLGAIDAELARFAHLATPIATLPQAISNLEAAILELAGAEAAASLLTEVSPIDTSSVLSASINSAYEDILGRAADPAGMSFYTGSGLTLDQIAADLRTSDEYRTNIFTNQIDALTQDILGRPATAADQAAAWAQWLDGTSYNQIGAGMQSVADLVAAEEAAAIPDYMDPSKKILDAPGFASGGVHSGGYRWVGENGPELEFTGPSRVYSTEQSRDLLGMGEMSRQIASLTEEVKRLREENAEMQSQTYRVAEKTSKTLTKWDRDGQPAERT